MNFLNPEEQKRIAIRKVSAEPKPAAPLPGAKPGAAAAPGAKPGLKPGVPGAKPGPAPTVVNAVVKPKPAPQVQVLQVEDGAFEVHFTCSCGEQYVIRCDSLVKTEPPPAP